MVAVLPVLMYPLLGTTFFQLAQFMQQHTGQVVVVGAEQLEDFEGTKLFAEEGFSPIFCDDASLLEVEQRAATPADNSLTVEREELATGDVDIVLYFPDEFAEQLATLREKLLEFEKSDKNQSFLALGSEVPKPAILTNSAREQSQVTQMRVERVLSRWQKQVIQSNLEMSRVPVAATEPFVIERQDVAVSEAKDARLWSKLLPFVVFVWALTGAFYPAIDLCAGEKERGTLETLLASPAHRSEIVVGKLLTVMTFSIFTALLNMASLAITARMVIGQLGAMFPGGSADIAPPSITAMLWLVVALIPVAALFSALSLACASFARSTKEGQYYFMPLFLAAMPLMLMPMSPGIELNLGNSMVPVMGLVLLLRAVIEGQMTEAMTYFIPATIVTGICCWLATRWAISQFNQESVLFRESERFSLKGWAASIVRHRSDVPSAGAAMTCAAAIFIMQFLVRLGLTNWIPSELTFSYFALTLILSLVVSIALPALFVVGTLTTSWVKGLMLDSKPLSNGVLGAALMAILLAPAGQWLSIAIQQAYPISAQLEQELRGIGSLINMAPSLGLLLFFMAVLPAVCEEFAFRGVILRGLRKPLGNSGAILISAVLFGATHTILQQSLSAAVLGLVIGLVCVRTGNLLACIAFHAVYNASGLIFAHFQDVLRTSVVDSPPLRTVFCEFGPEQVGYQPEIAILGGLAAFVLLLRMKPSGKR